MSNLIFSWKIGGEAGFGIKSAGLAFAKACLRAGYNLFDYTEYPSLIRGGYNTYELTVGAEPVRSAREKIDILVALNEETVKKHQAELADGAAVIFDSEKVKIYAARLKAKKIILASLPLGKIAKDSGGEIMVNTAAVGASLALLKLPFVLLENVLAEIFSGKKDLIKLNIAASRAGYEYIKNNYQNSGFKISLPVLKSKSRIFIPGNEAAALGALAAGLNFFAAYPMTPATSILQYLAARAVKENLIVKHAEDEISVINMALGAAHVGARAMCATSGGGFALMNEGLGLNGLTETPLVLINVQRPGPATGLPTWTEQGDLQFVLRSAQGEFPRIILTPGDIEECFYETAKALNLAEKYQLPVIILLDKFLGEGAGSVPLFNANKIKIERGKLLKEKDILKDYRRYKLTADGISPRALPGMPGGLFLANSDEHNEYGYSSDDGANRTAQVDKRARKLLKAASELDKVNVCGPKEAKIALVCWGSVKSSALDGLAELEEKERKKFKLIHFNIIWPFPRASFLAAVKGAKKIVLVENNSEAQLGQLIRQETGLFIKDRILKYNGRPFFADELAGKFKKI